MPVNITGVQGTLKAMRQFDPDLAKQMNKQIKILFFVFCISFSSYSQQFLFKTTGFTVMEKSNRGQWGNWSKFIESEMMIKVDGINHSNQITFCCILINIINIFGNF